MHMVEKIHMKGYISILYKLRFLLLIGLIARKNKGERIDFIKIYPLTLMAFEVVRNSSELLQTQM